MADLRRFGPLDFLLLVLVLALAGGTRAFYLYQVCDMGRSPGPLRVQDARLSLDHLGSGVPAEPAGGRGTPGPARQSRSQEKTLKPLAGSGGATELDEIVDSVKKASKDWFTVRTPVAGRAEASAFTSPGYPFLIGLLGRALDPDPENRDKFFMTIRWIQCGLGALTAAFYFLIARRAFASLFVATLTGILCAIHPFWVIDTANIDDGVLAAFLLAAILFFGIRAVQVSGAFSSLLYGIALAALALVRAALLPFTVVAFLWFLLRSRTVPRGWLCGLLALLGFANGLVPWMVWNWQRFNDVYPIVDSTYVHLFLGNHPKATGGAPSLEDWNQVRTITSQVVARQKRGPELEVRIEKELTNNSLAALDRRLMAGLYFFFGERWFRAPTESRSQDESKVQDETSRLAERVPGHEDEMPDWLAWSYPGALSGSLLVMLLLGVLGWRWTYGWRLLAMPSSLAIMWIPVPYILSHAEALSGPRLPMDGVLLCYAAFALGFFIPGISEKLRTGYHPVVREVVRR